MKSKIEVTTSYPASMMTEGYPTQVCQGGCGRVIPAHIDHCLCDNCTAAEYEAWFARETRYARINGQMERELGAIELKIHWLEGKLDQAEEKSADSVEMLMAPIQLQLLYEFKGTYMDILGR